MSAVVDAGGSEFLGPGEPGPYRILARRPALPALVVCDHASNRIPARLNGLGISEADLDTHFALDVGADAVARYLSERFSLPAVLTEYSRLVVDCNRRLDDPTAFPEFIDGVMVPGNQQLRRRERQARADALYWPYHHAVRDQLTALEAHANAPALIAIHSFTPVFGGERRPWHFGILWDQDPRMAERLLEWFGAVPGVLAGDNQPYSGRHPHDFTVDHHAEAEGLPHASIEIRQDLIDTDAGAEHWGALLGDALEPILRDETLYTHWTR